MLVECVVECERRFPRAGAVGNDRDLFVIVVVKRTGWSQMSAGVFAVSLGGLSMVGLRFVL